MRGRVRGRRGVIGLTGLMVLGLALPAWEWSRRDPVWPIRVTLDVPPGETALDFSADGRWFLTRPDRDGSVEERAWDPQTGRSVNVLLGPPLKQPIVARDRSFRVGWSQPNRGADAELMQVDAASGAVRRRFAVDSQNLKSADPFDDIVSFCGEVEPWSCSDIRPTLVDGDQSVRLLCRDGRGVLEARIWNLASGAETRRPIVEPVERGVADLTRPIAESPDGRLAVYQAKDFQGLQLWDLDQGRPHGPRILSRSRKLSWVEFSADGRIMLTPALDAEFGRIDVWDVGECRRLRSLAAVSPGFHRGSLAIALDGRSLVAFNRRDRSNSLVTRVNDLARRSIPGWNDSGWSEVVVADLGTGQRLARSVDSFTPIFGPDGRTIITWEPGGRHVVREVPRPEPGQSGEPER